MASWLKGRFRKPEGFPAEAGDVRALLLHGRMRACLPVRVPEGWHEACAKPAGRGNVQLHPPAHTFAPPLLPPPPASASPPKQYHIVVLPTFRDQHAELVQYLLQLPRLEKQRYFLTQHNPGARGEAAVAGGGHRGRDCR